VSKTADQPVFQQYQYEFTRHIRDPKTHPRPVGVTERGMNVYARMTYDNLESFLLACFPVLRKVLGKREWERLARDFFAHHQCRTPYFRQIPDEFIQYLQDRGQPPRDAPFLLHLAHYEWIELVLSVSNKEVEPDTIVLDGNLLQGRPVLNPVSALLNYPYAVQRIGPKYKPTEGEQQQTFILAFRNLVDEVRFVVLNPVAARLVELLQAGGLSGAQVLQQIAAELDHPDPQTVVAGGLEILENLRREQAILGISA
jgi:hypothetical protein